MKQQYSRSEFLSALEDLETRFRKVKEMAETVLDEKDWLTVPEAAAKAGIKPKTVSNYCGKGRYRRIKKAKNGTWLIHKSEIEP